MSKLIKLDNLKPDIGAKHRKKRVGRGHGSGHGKTSCKGHKGQKARTGLDIRPVFEGGQTPIIRRVPKRGFKNIFKIAYTVINIKDLLSKFKSGEVVDLESLRERGLLKELKKPVKLLGEGEIDFPLIVRVHSASKSAVEKIEKAGGKVEFVS